MPRYSLHVSERYDDDDAPSNLHRVVGAPIGLSTSEWPRHHGRPMQHAFTLDLEEVELDLPRAAEARVMAVFVDSYYELDVGQSEGIRVLWLTQAQVDAHPQTLAPADFVAELRPGHETMDEEGDYYERGEPMLEVELLDDDDDELGFGDSFVGGSPVWGDAGEPASRPAGGFVMQVMSHELPVCRPMACMFVFESGAYIRAEYPDDENLPMPWPKAIANSRELIVLDRAPAADALQKWGGLPRGVSSHDWPTRMSHILTWVPEPKPESMTGVALALFGRLAKTDNWEIGQVTFYELREIFERDLELPELPEDVELLAERALELREFAEGTTWRDLQVRSFVGPRPAWPCPDHRSAESSEGMVMQLTEALLPVSPGRGSLIATVSGGYPIWHPLPGAPQASTQRYVPAGTLHAEDTSAAIVVGWQLSFAEFSVLPEKIEALEQTLLAALATRHPDHGLSLYVPGDTTTDGDGEVHGTVVLGRSVAVVEANDYDPVELDLAGMKAALAQLPALDESFWREALAFTTDFEAPDGPDIYLLSWGPLCYAGVVAGVAASKDDEHVYRFIANQDMQQEWSTAGVDGVTVESVEFSSVTPLELGDEQLARASQHAAPGFWLICRYD